MASLQDIVNRVAADGAAARAEGRRTKAALAALLGLTGSKADDAAVIHRAGDETKSGVLTLSSAPVVPDGSFTQAKVTNLTTDLAGKAADNAVVKLSGDQTIAGVKTFSSAPVVPDGSFTQAKVTNLTTDLAGKAADNAVVKLTGDQTVVGVKTFSTAPVVPDGSFAQAKVTGLTTDLAGKVSTANVEQSYIMSLPAGLLVETPVNPAAQLEAFLNTCSNKRVVFPRNKTFTLEYSIALSQVSNCEIDFAGCTLKVPDSCAWASRTVNGTFIGKTPFNVTGGSNVHVKNLVVDGNKANNAASGIIGVSVDASSDVTFENTLFNNVNYHAVVISGETPRIKFLNTRYIGCCGYTNSSDVYLNNTATSSAEFHGTYVEHLTQAESTGQAFYINGYNSTITNVKAKLVGAPLVDYRCGRHQLDGVFAYDCDSLLIVRNTDSVNYPEITATNLFGDNLSGIGTGACGIYIYACEAVRIENAFIRFAPASATRLYGVRVRRIAGTSGYIRNVVVKNIKIQNESTAAVRLEELDTTAVFDGVVAGANDAGARTVYVTGASAYQVVKRLSNSGASTLGAYDPGNMLRLTEATEWPTSGTTVQRPSTAPVGHEYYDTTLTKPVWVKTAGTCEVDTLTVTGGATAAGNVTVTLNGVAVNVAVVATDDTAAEVAAKIRAAAFSGWTTGGTGATVTFTKNTTGTNTAPAFDAAATGVTATPAVTTAGVATVWTEALGTDFSPSGTPGVVDVDSFAGANDDAKFLAALTYAAAQTRVPAVRCRAGVTTLANSYDMFTGMKVIGAGPENMAFGEEVSSGKAVISKIRFTGASGTSSLFKSAATINYVTVANLAFHGDADCQIFQSTGNVYGAQFHNLDFYGCLSAFGNSTNKFLMTFSHFTGFWTVNAPAGTQFWLGGSDNTLWMGGQANIGGNPSTAGAGLYLAELQGLSKTNVGYAYITANNGWRGLRTSGDCAGLVLHGGVYEGQNDSDPSAGNLIRCEGTGTVRIRDPFLAYGMTSPAGTEHGIVEVACSANGQVLLDGFTYRRDNDVAETVPVAYVSGGSLRVLNAMADKQYNAWVGLPRVQNAGGTLTNDATVTVL